MCGLPGTGKTTTAHRIRKAMENTAVISRHLYKNPHMKIGCLDEYANKDAKSIDCNFYVRASELLSNYTTVILDATFRERAKREVAVEFARKHGCDLILIECICSYQVLLERLKRQMLLGQKYFINTPEEVLEYYIKSTQALDGELSSTTFFQLDTEKNLIKKKSLQIQSCQFVRQLIEILEQPFDPSSLRSFSTISFQKNVSAQETAQLDFFRTKTEKNFSFYRRERNLTSSIYKVIESFRSLDFIHKINFTSILKILGQKKSHFRKRIVVMCGCPGTGKTTIARRIHQVMNSTSVIIHRDSIQELHLGKGNHYLLDNNVMPAQIDQEVLKQAKKQLREYDIIILDAGFREYSKRQQVYKFAQKYRCEVVVIHCICNDEISRQRLEQQIQRGEKTFNIPLKRFLKYHHSTFDKPPYKSDKPPYESDSAAATIVKVNTDQNQVTTLGPRENPSSDFVTQLIQILESPPCPETSKEHD